MTVLTWDLQPKIAAILKEHKCEVDVRRGQTTCTCGLIFNAIDARTWERHAAAMLLNALLGEDHGAD